MRGNRTPPPAVQTSIAEGTPRAGFGNGTPSGRLQTAIAEGTPANAAGGGSGGPGGFGGGRALTTVATVLGIDQAQLRSELQASGATIASVAAAHGFDRDALKQALIDATRQRLADSVASGAITQDMADQQSSQFETGIDALIDGSGGPPPPPSSP
jgi:hypothetical protein